MIRTLHLGKEGEDAAQHLLDVYRLSTLFEPCLAISPFGRVLDELRRRLAETAGRLERWEPDENLGERVAELTSGWQPGDPRPVIWLQHQRFDAERWRPALTQLQHQRELYRAEAPWMWVLAGPPELVPLIHRQAMHILTGVSVRVFVYQPPRRMPSAAEPVRWLHLSDFHFQALERWDRRATLKALLRHVEELGAEGLRPDFVLVTGDVGFSGQRGEYEQAERFFTELARTLDLEPGDRFFLVPGNHDVDRGAIGPGDRYIVDSLRSEDAIEEIFEDAATMRLLGRRLEGFYAFTERFLGAARGWHGERPWRVDVRRAGGVDVGILQLNSAWASGADGETGRLLIGEVQVRQALEESADAFLRIVLVHHPLADLCDFDRERLETLYAAENVHFLLRGHLHRNRTQAVATPDGLVVELAAGAVYPGGDHEKNHLFTEADLGGGHARVHFFRYSGSGRGFWTADNLTYEQARDGIWTLELPVHLALDAGEPPAAERELGAARRATLAARYRTAAAAVHGTVRFVGFADHRPRPNVEVPELFVPLRLEEPTGERGEHGTVLVSWTTSELLGRLLRRSDDGSASRFVVLGDPGSGKTTLCRFAAVAIAGEADGDGPEPDDDLLPLFVPFRDYVRLCREAGDRSLVEFLGEQARTQLQLTIPDAYLEQALEAGRAVLLLDGLDEVGSAADREEMRQRVQAFCRVYPRVPALITSRVAGYEDAPLSRQVGGGFVHLKLEPFDDGDLRRFVASWYAVQEATDPLARDRGVADLAAALEADPRVRELARNPMLATLIALVHRYEARLPGERAALYDICVKTLLETWPEARRRTFREIDARLQRAYLEALAFRMQRSRGLDDREVEIERQALVEEFAEIVRERGETAAAPEKTLGLVERWVRFLEQGTGLLVEQRPGVFAFFHLSLMEYLAARGMEEAEVPEEAIAERFDNAAWREVCLLAVGSRATKKGFLDRLYDNLRDRPGGWSFLLRCLREEAAFGDEQRSAIVRGAARDLLGKVHYEWKDVQRTVDDVMRFSIRHAEWARAWVPAEIATAGGEGLRAVVALRHHDEAVLEVLDRRQDAARAGADLLDYWPEPGVGEWAAGRVGPREAFDWAKESPGELLVMRALRAITHGESLVSGLILGVLRQAPRMATLARRAAERLADRECLGGRGLPAAVAVEPGSLALPVSPGALSFFLQEEQGPDLARYFALDFTRDLARDLARDFTPYYTPYFTLNIASFAHVAKFFDGGEEFRQDFAASLGEDSAEEFRGFVIHLALSLMQHYFPDSSIGFLPDFLVDVLAVFALEILPKAPTTSRPEPPNPRPAADAAVWREIRGIDDREALAQHLAPGFARLAAEAWIALVTTAGSPKGERRAYLDHRIHNAWLLQAWPAVDETLPDSPSPELLALYLALGFTQATTTWQWPATERWIALLGGAPPADWLPRSQWHLCWLLHDPEDAGHRPGLDEAIDEGLADEERPWVAEELRKLFPAG